MPLNNQLAPERLDWSFMAFSGLPREAGVLFEEVTLDERIGPEAVALLIEPEPDELLAKRTLDLNLKAGIAATAYGPVLFLGHQNRSRSGHLPEAGELVRDRRQRSQPPTMP